VKGQYQDLRTTVLDLDLENPRLPEDMKGSSESAILTYLWDHGTLEELAQSLVDNGYFGHEPLIVVEAGERYTVLEGNRRLATLQILLGLGVSGDTGLSFALDPPATAAQLEQLNAVPCFVVDNKDEVHNFLGFRHIGGLKMWSAEAKARYLLAEVHRTAQQSPNGKNVFRAVGRRVGSNAQGVRNPYLALSLLLHARDDFGIQISYVQRERFGVWVRCMNSKDLRDYMDLGAPTTFRDVENAVARVQKPKLEEVINDLTPQSGSKATLLDSRDVTVYGQILTNERAREVLRDTGSLRVARQVVERAGMAERIERLIQTLRLILDEVQEYGAPDDSTDPAERLFKLARSLRTEIRGLADDPDPG
jgi:hypothetical protein